MITHTHLKKCSEKYIKPLCDYFPMIFYGRILSMWLKKIFVCFKCVKIFKFFSELNLR